MMRRASDSVSMATRWEARCRLKTWPLKLTHVGKIRSISEPTSAHSRVNSVHRPPGAHHTIKKPNYQIPPEGAGRHNVREKSVEETLTRPHTLKGRPSALCEWKS